MTRTIKIYRPRNSTQILDSQKTAYSLFSETPGVCGRIFFGSQGTGAYLCNKSWM